MNFKIFLYNIKSFNIFQSTQFNQDLQIECVAKPASSQLIELIESWHSIQFNIEASLNDWQACPNVDQVIPKNAMPLQTLSELELLVGFNSYFTTHSQFKNHEQIQRKCYDIKDALKTNSSTCSP